jgi:hypothetical protein
VKLRLDTLRQASSLNFPLGDDGVVWALPIHPWGVDSNKRTPNYTSLGPSGVLIMHAVI